MMTTSFLSASPEETAKIAESLAGTLTGGEVLLAEGDLGAGKTAFCKALGKALGVIGTINSPTFNLVKVYEGKRLTLYHVDAYRLEGKNGRLMDIGLDEIIGEKDVVTYVEWPEFLPELKDIHPLIHIRFEILDEERRRIVIDDERN